MRKKKAECADFEDTMAEFEEELIDAEETFDKIKGRIYNFDEIIVNIESMLDILDSRSLQAIFLVHVDRCRYDFC